MDQAVESDRDYITDLIPYRCPKCGDRRRFATLRELKHHLESDHAFKTACVRPAIFRQGKDKATKNATERAKEQSFVIQSERLFRKHQEANVNEDSDCNLFTEKMSPLLQSYKDDAAILELELQMSKQNEMRNKTENLRALHGSAINTDFKNILGSLSSEVVKTRKQHWNTADELYKSHDVMNGLEEAAENKCKEQRELIRQLLDGMKVKERELNLATKEQNEIKNEQERLSHETEELFRRADSHNETLKMELKRRNGTLDSLTNEIERLKAKSSQELRAKENKLKSAEEKMKRLKSERDQLIEETELILKRADADSEELRLALALKEHKLCDVNEELDTLRSEKHVMLLKTAEFYKRTEEGNDLMRKIIRAKDDQLDQAIEQLEKMKEVQQRLVAESQNLTDQADDNTSKMKVMLDAKEQEVQQTVFQLQKLKEEKQRLENHSKWEDSSTHDIKKLQDKVKRKEGELKTTKGQLQELKSFLKNAAEKERTARGKLEKFIGELITRAERAESELKSLKSQSSSSLGGAEKISQEITKEPGRDGMANDRLLPEQEPANPVRRKYTPAKPVRRKYKRDQKLAHDIVDLSTDAWQDRVHSTPDAYIINETDTSSNSRFDKHVPSYAYRESVMGNKKRNIQRVITDIHRSANIETQLQSPSSLAGREADKSFENGSYTNQERRNTVTARTENTFGDNQYGNDVDNRAHRNDQSSALNIRYLNENDIIAKPNLTSNFIIPDAVQENNYHISAETVQAMKYNPIHSTYREGDVDNSLRAKRHVRDNRSHELDRNNIEDYACYVPQPPLKEPIRLREPPYGHESTHPLNSIPRVPPHIYNMTPDLNKQYYPATRNVPRHYYTTERNQPYGGNNCLTNDKQYAFTDNRNTNGHCSRQRLRPVTKVITPATKGMALSTKEDYINVADTMPERHLLLERENDNVREIMTQTKSSDDWRMSEKVQYEELHEDEVDFPDELFVIPKSASDELTPELLTPEREKREMKPTISNDEKIQYRDDSIHALSRRNITERSDESFDKIVDDHGIIWDEMDTLPDVSDSELDQLPDRLSPSGSEALPTNNQTNVPVGNMKSSDEKDDAGLMQQSIKKVDYFENPNNTNAYRRTGLFDDINVQLRENMPVSIEQTINDTNSLPERFKSQSLKHDTKIMNEVENSNTKGTPANSHAITESSVGRQSIMRNDSRSKRFKPIHTTSSGKSSSSEKDMTSGGKEVHDLMSRSPIVSIHGSPDCGSDISDNAIAKQYNGDVRNVTHVSNVQTKVSAIFEEKLKLISEKYNLKRHNDEQNGQKDQLQSISDKYRQRRKDIVDGLMSRCIHSDVSLFKSADFNRSISLPEDNKKHGDSYPLHETSSLLHETSSLGRPASVTTNKSNEVSVQKDELPKHELHTASVDFNIQVPDIYNLNNVANAHCNQNEEAGMDNEIQITDHKDLVSNNKLVASFQIDNFKEIIQAQNTDSVVNQSLDLERVSKDEPLPTIEIKSSDDHSVQVNQNETPHGAEKTLDSVTENRMDNMSMDNASSEPMNYAMHQQKCETGDEISEQLKKADMSKGGNDSRNDNVENENSSGGFSIFAEPIDDSCSIGEDSNTQSMIDRSHFIDTDVDLDTDTESHYKGITTGRGDDTDSITRASSLEYAADGQRLKSSRNTMSSASSQG